MDPCSFVKVLVGGLALRIPVSSKPTRAGIHPSASPCFCEIRLPHFPLQTAVVPLISPRSSDPDVYNISASFHLEESEVKKLSSSSFACLGSSKPCLEISVFTGRQGSTCGVALGKLLGKFRVPVDLVGANEKAIVFHSGWVSIGKSKLDGAQLHLSVRAEPDLRYVFQYDGEVSSSPQIFQIQGSIRQPIFSCKFTSDRSARSRSLHRETSKKKGWMSTFGSEQEQDRRERKGWLVMIHDLSGSPVAAASMVTPFVPSPGSDRVSRSNPGAWLILRPDHRREDSWIPWGRLEAWRERGAVGGLGCKIELMAEGGGLPGMGNGLLLAESIISSTKGGKFLIDTGHGKSSGTPVANSPASTPRSSGDFNFSTWPFPAHGGFVMSSTVQAERKCSKPVVQLAMRHVTCMEDAAVFVALSAAVDLSMDACQLFTRKLKKALCHQDG
ncbi:hypothetical protein KI387_032277 [Taxus chinensis]|uniref:Uncharacterized protein n=1 Tax=Taxus chinensis TaxID=29808 RepID=A0AA38F3C8_TAXCH|nr:hypothetical protein KI387_032277 [Taxus chinensis]